uniref:LapA family protein n=1 Tax=uncultured Altererythrobacter sp. TaxID=500840 RepID=UPI00261319FA|nr:LapA family protein [uncultured Altererythrobacter sp.]
MQIVRTVLWVLIFVGIALFSAINWKPVEVNLWGDFVVETKVPVLVIVSFLLGLVPMWLYHRGAKWSLNRRIGSLENAVRSTALSSRHSAPPPSPASNAPAPPVADPAPTGDTLKPDGNS